MKSRFSIIHWLALAAILCWFITTDSIGKDVRDDAVLRVTFTNSQPTDISAGAISTPVTATALTYTTSIPAMANSYGTAAVFDGTNSLLSYGLGADNELKTESAFTYHARVRHDAAKLAQGRGEQWIMGRFRSVDQGTTTRVTALSTTGPVPVGATSVTLNGGVSSLGDGYDVRFAKGGFLGGIFYDIFLRFEPGVAVTATIFNAETGALLYRQYIATSVTTLKDVNSPFDVGNRTMAPVPLAGEIEQINVWNRALGDDEMAALPGDPGFAELALIQNLQPTNNTSFLPATTEIQFTAQSQATIPVGNISLVLNGVDRSSDLIVTGDSTTRQVRFNQLQANTVYQADITVADSAGRSKTMQLNFNTFSQGLVFMEAEDYNFDGGQFINNPVLSTSPGPDNYLDRMSVEGVDRHFLGKPAKTLYRVGDGVHTEYCNDWLRQNFADAQASNPGITDYAVAGLRNGFWLNYSRVFPTGWYTVFARLANPNEAIVADTQLSLVTAGSSSSNQTLRALGFFRAQPAGGSQSYSFVPLSDVMGQPVSVFLEGQQTLRFTTVSETVPSANYFLLVPSQAQATPYITSVSPFPGETSVRWDAIISANIHNGATQVSGPSVRLLLSGQDVTAQAALTPVPEGLNVSIQPGSLPSLSTQTVTLIFSDNAASPKWSTNTWQFTVRRVPGANTPEIFADAVLHVTFANDQPADLSTGNISVPVTATALTYTTNLPVMANSDGKAAVFDGTNSFLSYGLGAANELKIETAQTYHVRVRYDAAKLLLGRPEQWIMGRFRSTTQGNNTRVTSLTTPAAGVGSTAVTINSGYSPNGTGYTAITSPAVVRGGIFYDLFVRINPGVAFTQTIVNAELGEQVYNTTLAMTALALFDADSPFDVGNRTMASTVPFAGEIEQLNVWNRVLSNDEVLTVSRGRPPGAKLIGLLPVGGTEWELIVETDAAASSCTVESCTALGGSWSNVTGTTWSGPVGNQLRAHFPAGTETTQFYRVRVQ